MKTLYTLTLSLFCLVGVLHAQTQVQFAVDMNGAENFDPDTDTLRVAGNFQGWTPRDATGANILTDDDGNGVYAVTLPVSPGEIQFKYVINIWDGSGGFNEFSGTTPILSADTSCINADDNRIESIPADSSLSLPVYVYNSCDVSDLVVSSTRNLAQLRGVTLAPNPMRDRALMQLPEVSDYTVRIMDVTGRVVRTERLDAQRQYVVTRDNLPGGIYLIDVVDERAGQRAVLRLSMD